MKRLLLILSILSLTILLFSETIIDNTVNYGIWNEAGSPYIVTTNVEIPQGDTLSIEPGVTVLINNNISFTAYGVLNVNGEENNLTYIQAIDENTMWDGIKIHSEAGNISYTNIIGAIKGLAIYKTNYVDFCSIIGYGTPDFEEGLYVADDNQSEISNVDIYGYMTGVTIKTDTDGDGDDDDAHGPTTPTMDVIRIYWSPESWKGERTVATKGIYMDDDVEPTLTNIEIENYDEGITIKADADGDGNDDNDHGPTTPTMDVIRIYWSPESWKGERTVATKGIVIEGNINPVMTDIEIENYDEGITIKVDADGDGDEDNDHGPTTPTMDVIRIYWSPESWKGERTVATKGIVIDGNINPAMTDIEIENYDEGITIKVDADGDGDDDNDHGPTTPTMDVIRIYWSPESWKGERTVATKGIVIDGDINPAMTDIEIENYDEGITIRVDADGDGDEDNDHGPTTPTMDVIRIYWSPESWKGDRVFTTNGIAVEGNINLTGNNIEIENYDVGIDFNSTGEQVLNNVLIPNTLRASNNYGIKSKGDNSLSINTINIQNYDNAIYFKTDSTPVTANIINAVISNYNNDRVNSKALYFKGAVNLFVDNSHITDYDTSIFLKNNYNVTVEAKVEHTELYQTEARRGSFKGIDFRGKVEAIINNNVIKSCDPAVQVSGTNSISEINRNLMFITYHKNNSKGIDVNNIDNNIMKHNTIVNYDKGLTSRFTPSEVVNNIIWKENPGNNLISNYSYVNARYNNISLPDGEIYPGISNFNQIPDFMGNVDNNNDKDNFAEKFSEFQLNPNSPCIDAGDPEEVPDGDGTIPDLGVFEFVGNKDLIQSIDHEVTLNNYPNPFNPTTNILFSVAEEGLVDVKVYNLKGQVVRSLLKENRAVGNHRVVWNGENNSGLKVASGIYFVRLKQHNINVTRKIILTK